VVDDIDKKFFDSDCTTLSALMDHCQNPPPATSTSDTDLSPTSAVEVPSSLNTAEHDALSRTRSAGPQTLSLSAYGAHSGTAGKESPTQEKTGEEGEPEIKTGEEGESDSSDTNVNPPSDDEVIAAPLLTLPHSNPPTHNPHTLPPRPPLSFKWKFERSVCAGPKSGGECKI